MRWGTHQLSCKTLLLGVTALAFMGFLKQWLSLPVRPKSSAPSHLAEVWQTARTPSRLLPHAYWAHRQAHPESYDQLSCSDFPSPGDLEYVATCWQCLAITNGSVFVHSSHWDARGPEPLVRLLIYCDVIPLPNLTCLLWYENRNAPQAVPASATYGWHTYWGGPYDTVNEPYVLACEPPRGPTGEYPHGPAGAPRAVSLATAPCETPRNAVAVQGAPHETDAPRAAPSVTSVAVSVKWLSYTADKSTDLVEWIELLRTFGAEMLYIYVMQLHPNMRRVLQYYSGLGFVDVTELDFMPRRREHGSDSNLEFTAMRRELLPFNDALYRAIGRHSWLAVFDMDELIVPLMDDTWPKLIAREMRKMEETKESSFDALVFLNFFFLRGAQRELAEPPPAHMLANVWRASNHSEPGWYVKSFHNVSSVVAMHNHMPMSCGAHDCRSYDVPIETGRLQHYRSSCSGDAANCTELYDVVRDAALARYRHVLPTVRNVLRMLDIPVPGV